MDSNKILVFLTLWISSSLSFILFDKLFVNEIVLGNDRVVAPMAAIVGGLIVSSAYYLVEPLLKRTGTRISDKRLLLIFYLVGNMAAIWVTKRLEIVTGVGIANNFYVVYVAVFATAAQLVATKFIAPLFLAKKKK